MPRVRVLVFFGGMFWGSCFLSLASIPTNNGVLQTGQAIDSLLNANDTESLYYRCQNQGRGSRYFSDSCTKLIDTLRKRIDILVLESDLQIQAEKLAKPTLSKSAMSRISVLAQINLRSTQAEDAIKVLQNSAKGSDLKDDLPDVLTSVNKVQLLVANYSKLFGDGLKK